MHHNESFRRQRRYGYLWWKIYCSKGKLGERTIESVKEDCTSGCADDMIQVVLDLRERFPLIHRRCQLEMLLHHLQQFANSAIKCSCSETQIKVLLCHLYMLLLIMLFRVIDQSSTVPWMYAVVNHAVQRHRSKFYCAMDVAMDSVHRAALRQNWIFLMDNLVMQELVDKLYERGLLTDDMKEEIQVERTKRDQISKFLSILQRRGPHAFENFINALQETSQEFIAEKLIDTVQRSCQTNW